MSKLDAFLKPVSGDETKEVVISKRFVDGDGKPVPFRIRTISEAQNQEIRRSCTRKHRDRTGAMVTEFDAEAYAQKLVLAGTMEPDFTASEMCAAYGTMDPTEVPGKMLLAGEYRRLSDAIAALSDFNDDAEAEAKNS